MATEAENGSHRAHASMDHSPMKTLLLLRHAKSGWEDPLAPDHERTLTAGGKRAALKMGQRLGAAGLLPDLILCSTARRATSTCELVRESLGYGGRVEYMKELYLAEPQVYLDAVCEQAAAAECVLLIGHNPGIESLLSTLIGREERMPTAALACLALAGGDFSTMSVTTRCQLEHFWKPKEPGD